MTAEERLERPERQLARARRGSRWLVGGFLLAAGLGLVMLSAAWADTFTNKETGEVLKGSLVGTVGAGDKQEYIVKLESGQQKRLPTLGWDVQKEARPGAEPAKPPTTGQAGSQEAKGEPPEKQAPPSKGAAEAPPDAPKAPTTYGSVRAVMAKLPKDKLPPRNAGFWNDLQLKVASDWLNENLGGCKLATSLTFGSAQVPTKDFVWASFWDRGFVVGNLRILNVRVEGLFPSEQVGALSKLVNGRRYTITGVIDRAEIRGGGGKSSKDPCCPTDVTLRLSGCRVSGSN